MKIGEGTEFKIDLKTIISLVVITASFVGMYYTLQSEIEVAKELPPAVIDRIEYDLKRDWMEQHIMRSEEEIDKLKEVVKDLDRELHSKKDK
tara:strand:+ start:843 stop:1118 length:276 start_codon:yes stop_codon:yes gene_type:complete